MRHSSTGHDETCPGASGSCGAPATHHIVYGSGCANVCEPCAKRIAKVRRGSTIERRPVERVYSLSKIEAGDYLLASNDGRTLWRVRSYVDGPTYGLEDWPADCEVWGAWQWRRPLDPDDPEWPDVADLRLDDIDEWVLRISSCRTRSQAVDEALTAAPLKVR